MKKIYLFKVRFLIYSNKPVWDGKKDADNRKVKFNIKALSNDGIKYVAEIKEIGQIYYEGEIDVLNYIVLKNIPFLLIDVTEFNSADRGFRADLNIEHYVKQTISFNSKNQNLIESTQSSCYILHCEIGLYYHHNSIAGKGLKTHKVTDFLAIFYVKVTTANNIFLITKFEYEGDRYPLVICPYNDWLSPLSGAQFILSGHKGRIIKKFNDRHMLLPIYPRAPNSDKFLLGKIKYIDNTSINVGFEIKMIGSNVNMEVQDINVINGKFVCEPSDEETYYYHFSHSFTNGENEMEMEYVNVVSPGIPSIYHDQTIYLYKWKGSPIEALINDGLDYNGGNDPPSLKPSCKKKILPLHGKMVLLGENGKEIHLDDKNNKQFLYVNQSELNVPQKLICSIVIENSPIEGYGINFYKKTFREILVTADGTNEVKKENQLLFTNALDDFGAYKCTVEDVNKGELHKHHTFIKELTFEAVPIFDSIINRTISWDNTEGVVIECSNKIKGFATLKEMTVKLGSDKQYVMANSNVGTFFISTVNKTTLKQEYFKSANVKDVYFDCLYSTYLNFEFKSRIFGTIKENNGGGNNGQKNFIEEHMIFIICAAIGVIFLAILIGALIYIKKSKNAKKLRGSLSLESSSRSKQISKKSKQGNSSFSSPTTSKSRSQTSNSKSSSATKSSRTQTNKNSSKSQNLKKSKMF
uniref:Ig-like domain-containing protein n=1 Tax=Parastrongyloides trichosuri TaxID=131310 RepID=A0A0N5A2X3_PARTI